MIKGLKNKLLEGSHGEKKRKAFKTSEKRKIFKIK